MKVSELISVLGKTSISSLITPAALISTPIVSTRGFFFFFGEKLGCFGCERDPREGEEEERDHLVLGTLKLQL